MYRMHLVQTVHKSLEEDRWVEMYASYHTKNVQSNIAFQFLSL